MQADVRKTLEGTLLPMYRGPLQQGGNVISLTEGLKAIMLQETADNRSLAAVSNVVRFRDGYWRPNHTAGSDASSTTVELEAGTITLASDPSVRQNIDDAFCLAIVQLVHSRDQAFLPDIDDESDRSDSITRDTARFITLYANQLSRPEKYRLFRRFYEATCSDNIKESHPLKIKLRSLKETMPTGNLKAGGVPVPLTGEDDASLVYENGIVAITVKQELTLRTTVFYNTTDFAAPLMFAVDAQDRLGGDGTAKRKSRALLIDSFVWSINKDRACGWFVFDSTVESDKPTLITCGLVTGTDAISQAMVYIKAATVYHLEKVPRVFSIGRSELLRDVSALYSGHTTIHGEYLRYCDPHAYVDVPSVADRAIHKSLQLYCLMRTINSGLSSNASNFRRRMAAKAQRLFSDEDGLLQIMRLMRTMQVDSEFDRYFQVPERRSHPPQVYIGLVSGDPALDLGVWARGYLPSGSLVPAPRII